MSTRVVRDILLIIFFVINTCLDIKSREVSFASVLFFGTAGLILALMQGKEGLLQSITGILPGLVMLGTARLTREAVGYGDGAALAVCGIYLGIRDAFQVVCYALFLCSLLSGIWIMLKKKNKKMAVPFIPYLLSGIVCSRLF